MNSYQIRVEVGKARGWKLERHDGEFCLSNPHGLIVWKDFDPATTWDSCSYVLPDYGNDKNPIHEAIMAAAEKDGFGFQAVYQLRLQEVIERRRPDLNREQIGWWMNNATAYEQSEAFLRTLNLWREEKKV